MLPGNTTPLPGKMPNGQDREQYLQKAHKFIEENHKRIRHYAQNIGRGNRQRVEDMVQEVILVLLEGRQNIDFDRAPLSYVFMMLKQQRRMIYRRKQEGFEALSVVSTGDETSHHNHPQEEEKETHFDWIVSHLALIESHLNKEDWKYYTMMKSGLTQREITRREGITLLKLQKVREKVRKIAARLRAEQEGDLER